jgi:hypothetical protein
MVKQMCLSMKIADCVEKRDNNGKGNNMVAESTVRVRKQKQ